MDSDFLLYLPILVIILFVILRYYLDNKRIKDIARYCEKHDLKFVEKMESFHKVCSESFDIVNRNDFQSFSNLICGEQDGIKFSIFDFAHKNIFTERYYKTNTICILSKPRFKFPKFYIRSEYLSDKINNKFGTQDIDFDEDESFSNLFLLQGKNEKNIKEFFSPAIRKAFIKFHSYNYEFETSKNHFMIYTEGELSIEDIIKFLNNSIHLFNSIINPEK
ncbi:MAG: hypothetical protein J6Z11_16680 [Candidatus Riflebacteria bacterium]|nr:hypothetical protein [Candidatus Riflebacteria bacterium]